MALLLQAMAQLLIFDGLYGPEIQRAKFHGDELVWGNGIDLLTRIMYTRRQGDDQLGDCPKMTSHETAVMTSSLQARTWLP